MPRLGQMGTDEAMLHFPRPLPSPQTSKQAVHSAWKATETTASLGNRAQSSIGHAAQTSSSDSRGLLSPSKRSARLWRRQHLEAASVLAQQAALQVHAAFPCPPPPACPAPPAAAQGKGSRITQIAIGILSKSMSSSLCRSSKLLADPPKYHKACLLQLPAGAPALGL